MIDAGHWWLRRAITYIGRVDDSKGLDTIVDAYLALTDRELPPLWIVGGIPAEIELRRARLGPKIDALESRGLLEWWGFQREDGLSTILTRSLVLVTHSQYEPGGRVVLESLAAGVPVIGTPHGFARDLVRDWATGFLVPYGDVDLLRARIEHFIRQPLLRQALGANARRAAIAALSEWRFTDTHCDVYAAAADGAAIEPRERVLPIGDDVFTSRDFEGAHPFSRRDPSAEEVMAVVRGVDRGVHTIEAGHRAGSSMFWRVGDWLVKYPRPRFELRPMWDRRVRRIAAPAEERFAIELRSGSLPAFAPWAAVDHERLLLVRRTGRKLDRADALRALGNAIRKLAAAPVADEPVRSRIEDAWQQLMDGIDAGDVALPRDWSADDARVLEAARTASQFEERAVLNHGSPLHENVLDFDGEHCFIDGEHVHIGAEGEDYGITLLDTLRRWPDAEAQATLDLLAPPMPREHVLAWAAFFTFEGLCRHATLRHGTIYADFRRVWTLLGTLLRGVRSA